MKIVTTTIREMPDNDFWLWADRVVTVTNQMLGFERLCLTDMLDLLKKKSISIVDHERDHKITTTYEIVRDENGSKSKKSKKNKGR